MTDSDRDCDNNDDVIHEEDCPAESSPCLPQTHGLGMLSALVMSGLTIDLLWPVQGGQEWEGAS